MSNDYRTIRVTEKTYLRMLEIRDKIEKHGMDWMPRSTRVLAPDRRNKLMTLGSMLSAGIEAYNREINGMSIVDDLMHLRDGMSQGASRGTPELGPFVDELERLMARYELNPKKQEQDDEEE